MDAKSPQNFVSLTTMQLVPNNDDELIRLYGEFIMRFEKICSYLRFNILVILYPRYSKEDYRKVEILLEGQTADNLRKKALSLIIENYTTKSEIYKAAKDLSKEFEKIIPLRNSFAHGNSFLNKLSPLSEFDEGHLILQHSKLKSEGLDSNFMKFDAQKLINLVANTQYLGNAFEILYMIIKSERNNVDIKDSFIKILENNLKNIKSL